MRVFVTGATGFIGSAVVPELLRAGHHVIGLARSEDAAASLARAGAEAYRGTLDDLARLKEGVAAADGVIHLAFVHDFSDYIGAGETDRRAVEAMGEELAGSGRPLIVTSATTVLPPGRLGKEQDAGLPDSISAPRVAAEKIVQSLSERGVRGAVVRLAPSVHGQGDQAFLPALIQVARSQGVSAYVGDGSNRWPGVHRLDAARLFRLALESAPAGSHLHGAADEGIPIREIAAVIGRRLNLPLVSVTPDEAKDHFGWMARFIVADNPTSSAWTREQFGWQPEQPGLLTDLDSEAYFPL